MAPGRAELTLGAETDLFNFQFVKYFKIPTGVPDNWVNIGADYIDKNR